MYFRKFRVRIDMYLFYFMLYIIENVFYNINNLLVYCLKFKIIKLNGSVLFYDCSYF